MTNRGRRSSIFAFLLALATPGLPAVAAPAAIVAIGDLQWATAGNGADVRWRDADAFCRDLELGGHGDWRLPTLAELETLHDPDQPGGVRSPLELDGCCLWSSTSLAELPAEGQSETGASASRYRWGFLFDQGIRYYSVIFQPDGRALCTREGR